MILINYLQLKLINEIKYKKDYEAQVFQKGSPLIWNPAALG